MRSVAVKVFRLDITPEQAAELAAQLGMLAGANLAHPAVVAPLEAGLEGSVPFLAEDYFAAESLEAAIRQYGPPPVGQAVRILAATAGALDFAAAAGVHHGALHPRDLLVTPDDSCLTGLGIGRALEAIGLRAPMRRPYVAPERAQREGWDGRADVFSLGVLARELLAGRTRHDPAGEPRLPDEQAERLKPVLSRATAARPADRFSTCLELIGAVQDALAGGAGRTSMLPAGADSRPPRAEKAVGLRQQASRAGQPAHDLLSPLDVEARKEEEKTAGVAPLPDLDLRHAEGSRDGLADGFDLSEFESPASDQADSLGEMPVQRMGYDSEPLAGGFEGHGDAVGGEVLASGGPDAATEPSPSSEEPADRFADALEPPAEPAETEPVEPVDARGEREALRTPPAAEPAPLAATIGVHAAERRPPRFRGWTLIAMLLVGIVAGMAGGYRLGARRSNAGDASVSPGAPATTAAQPAPSSLSASPRAPASAAGSPGATPGASKTVTPVPPARSGLQTTDTPAALSARRAAPPAPSAAVRGTLIVRSTPRGASVAVNGRVRGVTPLSVRNLTAGRYTIRVSRRGYETEQRQVVVSTDRPSVTLNFSLGRVAEAQPASRTEFFGTLSVESLPSGARVFVDGRLVGTTPVASARIAAGSHVVRVDRTGFLPWTSPIQIVTGQNLRVTASLERESR